MSNNDDQRPLTAAEEAEGDDWADWAENVLPDTPVSRTALSGAAATRHARDLFGPATAGRPPLEPGMEPGETSRAIRVRLGKQLDERVTALAALQQRTMSELVREALHEYVENHGSSQPVPSEDSTAVTAAMLRRWARRDDPAPAVDFLITKGDASPLFAIEVKEGGYRETTADGHRPRRAAIETVVAQLQPLFSEAIANVRSTLGSVPSDDGEFADQMLRSLGIEHIIITNESDHSIEQVTPDSVHQP